MPDYARPPIHTASIKRFLSQDFMNLTLQICEICDTLGVKAITLAQPELNSQRHAVVRKDTSLPKWHFLNSTDC